MIGLSDTVSAAMAASLIAAWASLLGLIISKESKISEFRQAWIDALRSEVARLIAHANAIHGASTARPMSGGTAWDAARPDFVGINEAAALIRLRLKPTDAEEKAVLANIAELEKLLAPGVILDHDKINQEEKKLVGAAQTVVNREWRRVKHGEGGYRALRILLAATVTIGLALILIAI